MCPMSARPPRLLSTLRIVCAVAALMRPIEESAFAAFTPQDRKTLQDAVIKCVGKCSVDEKNKMRMKGGEGSEHCDHTKGQYRDAAWFTSTGKPCRDKDNGNFMKSWDTSKVEDLDSSMF